MKRTRSRGHKPDDSDLPVEWLYFDIHRDDRGSMSEVFRFDQHPPFQARQLNLSKSKAGVLRGLHWHVRQTDYWIMAEGMAQVVVGTPMVRGIELEFESRILTPGLGVKIPPHRPHGFLAITDMILVYAVNQTYNHEEPDEWNLAATKFDGWLTDPSQCIMSERDQRTLRGFPAGRIGSRLTKPTGSVRK